MRGGSRGSRLGGVTPGTNLEMGLPLLAPLLVRMVGGMGLQAAVLRQEKGPARTTGAAPTGRERDPEGFRDSR